MDNYPGSASLREVGLRDGLQGIANFMPTTAKCAWIDAEAAAGVAEIEVTSLVPPKLMPQFADAAEVIRHARGIKGLTVSALVPNLRGAERSFELDVDKLIFVMSVSATHNLHNIRRTREESVEDFKKIVGARKLLPAGRRPLITGGLSTAFGCSYEGRIDPNETVRLAVMLAEAGADEIVLADTVGYGNPAQVSKLFKAVAREVAVPLVGHFHDTRGTGLANVIAALEAGIVRFDASLAGLGGCPYAPGATGNIVMEDLCYMLAEMGVTTGIDIERLLNVRRFLSTHVEPAQMSGAISRAGLPRRTAAEC